MGEWRADLAIAGAMIPGIAPPGTRTSSVKLRRTIEPATAAFARHSLTSRSEAGGGVRRPPASR